MLTKIIYKLLFVIENMRISHVRKMMHVGENVAIKHGFKASRPRKITIGDGVSIHVNCVMQAQAPIKIGSGTLIAANCTIVTANHMITVSGDNNAIGGTESKPVTIGKNCWLGANVTILPGVTLADGAIIGAGSVVTKDMPANMICLGSPARPIKPRPIAPEIA